MKRFLAATAITGAWLLAGCSSVTVPLPCDLMIVTLPADSPLEAGDRVPANLDVIAAPDDFDALGSSIVTDETGRAAVQLKLRGGAIERLAGHTAAHIGDSMALAINGEIVAIPVINEQIPNGEMVVSPGIADDDAFAQRFAGCVR